MVEGGLNPQPLNHPYGQTTEEEATSHKRENDESEWDDREVAYDP